MIGCWHRMTTQSFENNFCECQLTPEDVVSALETAARGLVHAARNVVDAHSRREPNSVNVGELDAAIIHTAALLEETEM